MRPDTRNWSVFVALVGLTGCFLDASGQAQEGGGVAQPEGGGGAGGGAGASDGGASTTCGDGILEGDEECEDYNDDADNCVSCRFAGECGDGVIGGEEECDGSAECTDECRFQAGLCVDVPLLEQGMIDAQQSEIPGGAIFGQPDVQSCSTDASSAWLFRFETGAYPRGFAMLLDGDSVAPLVFATVGCGAQVLQCERGNDPLLVATELFSPGTIVFGGIVDEEGDPDTIEGRVRYHRFYEKFVENPVAWAVDTRFQWDEDAQELILTDVGSSKPTAFTPPLFVGGVDHVDISVTYDFHGQPDCDVHVIASFDDEAPKLVGILPQEDNYAEISVERGDAVKLVTGLQADIRGDCDFDLDNFAVFEPLD